MSGEIVPPSRALACMPGWPLLFLALSVPWQTPRACAAPGDLDLSFGERGRTLTGFFADATQQLTGLVLQLDPATDSYKLVGGGWSAAQVSRRVFALARYNLDGSLDPSFGSDGTATTYFFLEQGGLVVSRSSSMEALAVDASGRLVTAGWSLFEDGGDLRFALARFTADGHLDDTFGTHGKVLTDVSSAADYASAVALQPLEEVDALGRTQRVSLIVAAGTSGDPKASPMSPAHACFTLIRHLLDGSLDTRFGKGGIVRSPNFTYPRKGGDLTVEDGVAALAASKDGRLVAAGYAGFSDGRQLIAVRRYEPNGDADPTFGDAGAVITSVGHRSTTLALQLQSDRIVVAGEAFVDDKDPVTLLVRYEADGSLDPTFGDAGIVLLNMSPRGPTLGVEGAQALTVTARGDLVLAGGASAFTPASQSQFLASMLRADGSLDPGFGEGGVSRAHMPFEPNTFEIPRGGAATAIVETPDGSLVLGGNAVMGPDGIQSWGLIRLEGRAQGTHADGSFRRGDSNLDGTVDLSDAVTTLGFLFLGSPTRFACDDAADANDDGHIDLSDAVWTLSFKFLGTNTIPAPGPDACGADPTEDTLDLCAAGDERC